MSVAQRLSPASSPPSGLPPPTLSASDVKIALSHTPSRGAAFRVALTTDPEPDLHTLILHVAAGKDAEHLSSVPSW